jgi:hypothetical protein
MYKRHRGVSKNHLLDQIDAIENAYKSSFEEWRFLRPITRSLLGAGSKRNLLKWREQELDKEGSRLMVSTVTSPSKLF